MEKPGFNVFFTRRFYISGAISIVLFIIFWLLNWNPEIPKILIASLGLLTIGELAVLFRNKKGVDAVRLLPERFSNGDFNHISLLLTNHFPFFTRVTIIEELPEQFEIRNNRFSVNMGPLEKKTLRYAIKPLERGEYLFGFAQLYIQTRLGLVNRRIASAEPENVKVYPSFIQLRKYALLAQSAQQAEAGNRQLRKIGHSLEFEQIKEYVAGDDVRSVNWKATARKGGLMVNHYIDERSQQVYVIIDKGRLMKMPFNELTLLDYAINATLVLCNVCLHRQDKFGLITFSHKPGTVLPAQRNATQLNHVLEALYKQETDFLESDFEKLYLQVRTYVKHRSLLMIFTQFESIGGMKRQLPYLKQLSKHHLLMVVFFENTELGEIARQPVNDLEGIYNKTIAEKFVYEKNMIVKELQQNGILAVLSAPEKLTIQTVNKYLELKSKQAI
ncbi:MAG: DUF58 domain-containing protein [Chitinophagaceae bacterium]|nr:DUF58 domain-containing protein [Chitinophagaceae bacterium]